MISYDDAYDPYAIAYDDPANGAPPSQTESRGTYQGVPPPWWGNNPAPWAPGVTWQSQGPQTDPEGHVWDWNPTTGAWVQRGAGGAGDGGDGGDGDGGAGDGGPVDLTAPWTGTFTPPAPRFPGATGTGVPETPVFNAPGYTKPPAFDYAPFMDTTADMVRADPGFKFGFDQGLGAIKNNKAASGILNTGGALKDFINYGTDYGLARWSDVDTRRRNDYMMNRGNAVNDYRLNYDTQFTDPYAIAYRSASDAFAPRMTAYSTNAAANQRGNELDYGNAYDLFTGNREYDRLWKNDTFNKRWTVASA